MRKWCKWLTILIIIVLVIWVLWANTALEFNEITVQGTALPAEFNGFCIAHVSDFHSSALADEVIQKLQEAKPDIICITGDLIDRRSTDIAPILDFASALVKIAPCYFVTGNHETMISEQLYDSLLKGLSERDVILLEDREILIHRNDAQIALAGHFWGDTDNVGDISNFDGYRILLSHHPEAFDDYVKGKYDLVLAGHAHGGQVRLPFVGGIYAPGQGVFPEYDAGLYTKDNTNMIVSRGIGNSTIPLRVNNRPEVILVELRCLTPES